MPIRIEAYTLSGIVTGVTSWPGHLKDALEGSSELLVENPSWIALDGRPATVGAPIPLAVDDIALAVPDEAMPGPVHAAWHAITLEAGPYRIAGELATLPGFDPGRALTRPTGTFVLLRDVSVELLDRPDAGAVTHAQGLVNRYTVDFVEADLMLGFFFPGARIAIDPAGTTAPATPGGADPGAAETAAAATAASSEASPTAGGPAEPPPSEASAPAPTA